MVHVGIDGGDRCRHRHHGLERVAALGEDAAAGFGGGMVGCGDDAAAVAGGVKVHSGARETKAKRIRHERLKTPVVGTISICRGTYPRSAQSDRTAPRVCGHDPGADAMEFYLSFSELLSKFPNTIILVFVPVFIFTILAEALVIKARHGDYSWTNTGVSTLVAVGHVVAQAATHGIIFGIIAAGVYAVRLTTIPVSFHNRSACSCCSS